MLLTVFFILGFLGIFSKKFGDFSQNFGDFLSKASGNTVIADSYGYPQKKKKASKYLQLFVHVKFLHFLET